MPITHANKRVYYACEAVLLKPVVVAADGTMTRASSWMTPLGIQSIGMSTNFNLEKIYTLGQLAQYDAIEGNPEIEVTLNKIFDGTMPLFIACMGGKNGPNTDEVSLANGQNNMVDLRFGIYKDTGILTENASGVTYMECSGMYLKSANYAFPVEGNATEEVVLVGNNKTWHEGTAGEGIGVEKTAENFTTKSSGIVRRWKINRRKSYLPYGPKGIRIGAAGKPPVTNVSFSLDLGREPIYSLGSIDAYTRAVKLPLEINTTIETLAQEGDFQNISSKVGNFSCPSVAPVGAVNPAVNGDGGKNFTIKIVLCGGGTDDELEVDLGNKNVLNTVSFAGGDAGGGNLTSTYNFTTSNTFSMTAVGSYSKTDGVNVVAVVGNAASPSNAPAPPPPDDFNF